MLRLIALLCHLGEGCFLLLLTINSCRFYLCDHLDGFSYYLGDLPWLSCIDLVSWRDILTIGLKSFDYGLVG